MPASEPHRLSVGLHTALAVRSGLQRLNGFISKEYGKASEQKESKNFYAAFPAGISETPEMNNQFQYLFPTSGNDVYITLGDGHSTTFIHTTCHAAFIGCQAWHARLSAQKPCKEQCKLDCLTRQDIASMHMPLRKQ